QPVPDSGSRDQARGLTRAPAGAPPARPPIRPQDLHPAFTSASRLGPRLWSSTLHRGDDEMSGRGIFGFFMTLLFVGVLIAIGAGIYQAGVAQGVIDAGRFPAG